MDSTRYEEMYHDDLRLAERYLFFASLRRRRARSARSRFFTSFFWLFGLR